ncbi:MAG: hypothetical protein ACE5R6_03970 [Candidatus Heimdallarchaeota archaeon]
MKEIEFNTQKRMRILPKQVQEIVEKIQKQTYILLIFWSIIIGILTMIFYFTLRLPFPSARNFISSFLFAIVSVNWYISLPFLGVMLVIIARAKSRNYFFQLFPNLGILLIGTIVAFSNTMDFQGESVEVRIYIGVMLIIIVLEIIFLRLLISGVKENKKPLFFWTFFQDTQEAYASTILSQQALQISDMQNGYSQRPLFAPFSEISKHFSSLNEYQAKLESYAKFLTEKSELIGWDITNNSIVLYPRVMFGYADFGVGLIYLWDLLYRIVTKKRLTAINFNFEVQEISLRIAREDYNLLNNVTYHILGQQILERFKQSILAYLDGDIEKSYSLLLPLKT